MKNIIRNKQGAAGAKAIVALIAVLAVVMLYLSGAVQLNLPGAGVTDKYTEVVNRNALDTGIRIPINLKLTFDQDASTGSNSAFLAANMKHKHDTADSATGDVVPDAETVDSTSWTTDVGSTPDILTMFAVNGNSFQATNLTNSSTMQSLGGVQYGRADTNYKVWTTSTVHTPATTPGAASDDNSAILIQAICSHYRKGTNELLSRDTVTWTTYYELPTYNTDNDYTQSFLYYLYIPFDDFAQVEDIKVEIKAFISEATIRWTGVTSVTHVFWDFPVINGLFGGFLDATGVARLKLVMAKDSVIATAINYDWRALRSIGTDNSNLWGSHSYTYKMR